MKLLFESEAQRGQISFQILVQDPTDLNFKSKNNDRKGGTVAINDVLSQKLQLTKLRNVSWFQKQTKLIELLKSQKYPDSGILVNSIDTKILNLIQKTNMGPEIYRSENADNCLISNKNCRIWSKNINESKKIQILK